MSQTINVKEQIREAIANLPDDCTWDEAMYRIYLKQTVESGLEDLAAGRTIPHQEVTHEFGRGS